MIEIMLSDFQQTIRLESNYNEMIHILKGM